MIKIVTALVCAGWLGATIPAIAASHQDTDVASTIITNRLSDVAAGQGGSMKSLRNDALPENDPPRAHAAASIYAVKSAHSNSPAVSILQTAEPDRQFPWRKLAGFAAASIGGLYAVTKAASSITSPLLGRIIYFAFFCGIFLFAYTSHAESLVTTCYSMKEKVLDLFEAVDVRQSPESDAEGRQADGKRMSHFRPSP